MSIGLLRDSSESTLDVYLTSRANLNQQWFILTRARYNSETFYTAPCPFPFSRTARIKKLARLHLCTHLKVIPMHLRTGRHCGGFTRRAAAAVERMLHRRVASIRILPSLGKLFVADPTRFLSSAFPVADFYSWKHFKFRSQNWPGIPFAIGTFPRSSGSRADLPPRFIRHRDQFRFKSSPSFSSCRLDIDWCSFHGGRAPAHSIYVTFGWCAAARLFRLLFFPSFALHAEYAGRLSLKRWNFIERRETDRASGLT